MGYLGEIGDQVSWLSEKGLRCGTIVALYPKVETMLIRHPKSGDFYIKGTLENLRRIDFSVDSRGGHGTMAVAR